MNRPETSIPDPDREWQERKEQEYKQAVAAAEQLYQMSLTGETDVAKIKQLCEAIGPYGPFQDHLVISDEGTWEKGQYTEGEERIAPQFFETLPIVNRMAVIKKNFREKHDLFFNIEVSDISDNARFVLSQILPVVDKEVLAQLDETKTKDFFESLKLLLTSDSDVAIEETIKFLNTHKNTFEELSEAKGLPEIQSQVENLQNFLKTTEFEKVLVGAAQEGLRRQKTMGKRGGPLKIWYCEKLLRDVFVKYGFDPDEILEAWSGSYTEHGPQPQIRSNIDMVIDLEEKRPGITRLLYKEFGIRNFERYPESILIAQFDEFNDTAKPYGVMIQATHDWNGAFAAWSNRDCWDKLFNQIKDNYAFRIVEARSKIEIGRRLISLNQKYGQQNKISFAFIGGHGNENSILLGGPHRRNMLLFGDLVGRGIRKTGEFFKPHPTIVMVSCSTGAEGGIGQELSKALGAKVIAPSVPTNLQTIEAIIHDGNIDFKVEFKSEDKDQDIDKVYMGGQKI